MDLSDATPGLQAGSSTFQEPPRRFRPSICPCRGRCTQKNEDFAQFLCPEHCGEVQKMCLLGMVNHCIKRHLVSDKTDRFKCPGCGIRMELNMFLHHSFYDKKCMIFSKEMVLFLLLGNYGVVGQNRVEYVNSIMNRCVTEHFSSRYPPPPPASPIPQNDFEESILIYGKKQFWKKEREKMSLELGFSPPEEEIIETPVISPRYPVNIPRTPPEPVENFMDPEICFSPVQESQDPSRIPDSPYRELFMESDEKEEEKEEFWQEAGRKQLEDEEPSFLQTPGPETPRIDENWRNIGQGGNKIYYGNNRVENREPERNYNHSKVCVLELAMPKVPTTVAKTEQQQSKEAKKPKVMLKSILIKLKEEIKGDPSFFNDVLRPNYTDVATYKKEPEKKTAAEIFNESLVEKSLLIGPIREEPPAATKPNAITLQRLQASQLPKENKERTRSRSFDHRSRRNYRRARTPYRSRSRSRAGRYRTRSPHRDRESRCKSRRRSKSRYRSNSSECDSRERGHYRNHREPQRRRKERSRSRRAGEDSRRKRDKTPAKQEKKAINEAEKSAASKIKVGPIGESLLQRSELSSPPPAALSQHLTAEEAVNILRISELYHNTFNPQPNPPVQCSQLSASPQEDKSLQDLKKLVASLKLNNISYVRGIMSTLPAIKEAKASTENEPTDPRLAVRMKKKSSEPDWSAISKNVS